MNNKLQKNVEAKFLWVPGHKYHRLMKKPKKLELKLARMDDELFGVPMLAGIPEEFKSMIM